MITYTLRSDGLRQLFCQLSMQAVSPGELSVVERMMLADTKLWKGQSMSLNFFINELLVKSHLCAF